jgi:F-type H+-transporting ATPase subunit b
VLIDWFTVVAQIINFLILVALLKYFLYDRVIEAMKQRETSIRERLQKAEEKAQEAEKEAESYREKQREIENQRQDLLDQAKEEAAQKQEALTAEARKEVDKLSEKWKQALKKEQEHFSRDLRRLASQEIFAVARAAFKDLADTNVEEQAVEVFLNQLEGLQKKEMEEIEASLADGDKLVLIRSGFELTPKMQQKIKRSVHQRIAEDVKFKYETAPDLLLGIEMKTKGRKLAWSLDDYLANLEAAASHQIESPKNGNPITRT